MGTAGKVILGIIVIGAVIAIVALIMAPSIIESVFNSIKNISSSF